MTNPEIKTGRPSRGPTDPRKAFPPSIHCLKGAKRKKEREVKRLEKRTGRKGGEHSKVRNPFYVVS